MLWKINLSTDNQGLYLVGLLPVADKGRGTVTLPRTADFGIPRARIRANPEGAAAARMRLGDL